MNPTNLFSEILVCYACGGLMSLVSGKKGGYCGCLAASMRACDNRKLVKRQQVEDSILGVLMENLLSPDNYSRILELIGQEIAKAASQTPKILVEKQKALNLEERKLNNFIEFIGDGRGSKTLGEALCQTEKKVEELSEEIRLLKCTRNGVPSLPAPDWVEARLGNVIEILRARTAEAALLLRELLGKVVLEHGGSASPGAYVARARLDQAAVLTIPLSAETKGSNSFQMRSQGDYILSPASTILEICVI